MNITNQNVLQVCRYNPVSEGKLLKKFCPTPRHERKLRSVLSKLIKKGKLSKSIVNAEIYYNEIDNTIAVSDTDRLGDDNQDSLLDLKSINNEIG